MVSGVSLPSMLPLPSTNHITHPPSWTKAWIVWYPVSGTNVIGYKVYWGNYTNNFPNYVFTTNFGISLSNLLFSPIVSNSISQNRTTTNLNNYRPYYWAVSTIYNNSGIINESSLSTPQLIWPFVYTNRYDVAATFSSSNLLSYQIPPTSQTGFYRCGMTGTNAQLYSADSLISPNWTTITNKSGSFVVAETVSFYANGLKATNYSLTTAPKVSVSLVSITTNYIHSTLNTLITPIAVY
jgi:hypothetical protein